jgi:putative membrane protein
MQIFYWLVLFVVIGIAIFSVQNSNIPLITIKFLIWRFETSLIYTILGSIGIGILMTLFLWIPRAIKGSIRSKELKKKIENLETVLYRPADLGKEGNKRKEL